MSHNWRGFHALGRKQLTTRFSGMLTQTLQHRLPQWSRYRRHSRHTHRLQGNCSFKLGKRSTYLSMTCYLVYEKCMQGPLWPWTLRRPLVTNLLVCQYRRSVSAHNIIPHVLRFHLFPWLYEPGPIQLAGYVISTRVKLLLPAYYGLDQHSNALCPVWPQM